MPTGNTQISDIIVPEIFVPYQQQQTVIKTEIIQAGILTQSPMLNGLLAKNNGGLIFSVPSFLSLDSTDSTGSENVSTDEAADVQTLAAGAGTTLAAQNDARPQKTGTSLELATRLSRNNHWASADLSTALAGPDPIQSISSQTGGYWSQRLQRAFVETMVGVFADNTANNSGDYTFDSAVLNGGVFQDGLTNFTAENFINAIGTMGDAASNLTGLMVHSIVYNRLLINNLIDFIPDADGTTKIATYMGKRIVQDDGMPFSGGVFESWIFGAGAVQLGVDTPKVPIEISREPLAANGGGQEVLSNRVEWSIHPTGHAFDTVPGDGGPTNAQLALAANWTRVYPNRKQINLARLVSREF